MLKVFPNPAKNELNIQIPTSLRAKQSNLCVYNSMGQEISILRQAQDDISVKGSTKIDVSNYPKGVYFLMLEGNNQTWKGKLIVD